MAFSAFLFSHQCHLNHEDFQKCFQVKGGFCAYVISTESCVLEQDSNHPVQLQRLARILKLCMLHA